MSYLKRFLAAKHRFYENTIVIMFTAHKEITVGMSISH